VQDRFPASGHGSTFAGGPLACRMALEFLDEMQSLLPHVQAVGGQLRAALSRFGEVRGRGLMLAVPQSRPGDAIVDQARDAGLLLNCTQSTVVRFLPPYIVTAAHVQEAASILERGIL
jgi:acetylornithine/N-succinyldiaminopimelate aminotransferase